MNRLEAFIQALWPEWALRRMKARAQLRKMQEPRERVIPERAEGGWLARHDKHKHRPPAERI